MKNVTLITLLFFSMLSIAQGNQPKANQKQTRMERRESFTPEQQAELQVKRMTLDLNLNAKQQEEIKKMMINQAKKREATRNEVKSKKEKGEKLSNDERFDMQNKMLDDKIALKEEMKKILTADQFKKWEENSAQRQERKQNMISKRQANKIE